MVERVEALGAELDGVTLAHTEAALQTEIEKVVARPGNRVTAGVAERERRGCGEGAGVKEVFGRALAARQIYALAGDDVGTILRAGVGEVEREVKRVHRRAVL